MFFARNGITPIRLTYEDLISSPTQMIENIAQRLGFNGVLNVNQDKMTLQPQRDAISIAWRNRFLRDSADLTRLDHPLGPTRVLLRRLGLKAGAIFRRATGTSKRLQASWDTLDQSLPRDS
jgi:hypothetical protein